MGRTTRAETARRNRYQTPVNRGAYGMEIQSDGSMKSRREGRRQAETAGYSLSLSLKHSIS